MSKPVQIEITADADQARKEVAGLEGDFKDLGGSVEASLKGAGGDLGAVGAGAKQASAQVAGLDASFDRLADSAPATLQATGEELESTYRRGRKAAEGIDSISTQLQRVQAAAIAFAGVDSVAGLVKGAAETADAYNNLAARIQLATGAGEAFETAMDRVQAIALATNSSLDATGTLFTKLNEVGRSAGLSAEAAQNQALALTESINQAVQLSGASAQASEAAITQLVQGLQGGALRGDEFNSVMEQSPRLAKALADGLGVTTGELRKMAEQGALTSDVVINGLRGQAGVLKGEFEQLPPTVGRALQNLSTAWTVYVGEADKATGASAAAARAISALASNLDTIAGLLLDVGQAAAALGALRLAQTFLGIGTAATTSATAIAANASAMQATAAASTAATAGVGRLAGVLATLKSLTLAGLLTNIQDIGKWLGEGVAKLQGYKDATEELAREERIAAEVAANRVRLADEMAQQLRLQTDATLGLSKASRALVNDFDSAKTAGKATGDVLADMAKKANVIETAGIQTYIGALQELARAGKASGDQVRDALAQALKGEDLQAFEVRARVALSGAKQEADLLALALDASLRAAVERSGQSFAVLSGGMGAAARSAVNDTETIISGLDRLKAQGVDVGAAIRASLEQGLKTTDGQASLEALRGQVERVRKLIGEPLAQSFLDQIKAKTEQVNATFGELDTALKKLGITSDSDLRRAADQTRNLYDQVVRAGGSVREQAEAYRRMAEAAVASGDAQAVAYAKSQAAARGFEVATDAAGKTTVRAMGEATHAVNAVGGAMGAVGSRAQQISGQLDDLADRAAQVSAAMRTDSQGFSADDKGQRIAVGSSTATRTGVANFLGQAGVAKDLAEQLAQELSDGRGGIDAERVLRQYGRKSQSGTYYIDSVESALLRAAEGQRFGGAAPSGTPAARTVNVNLNVGGQSSQVAVASDADAQRLVEALRRAGLSA